MALNNDFKVKNGLTVIDSISAGGNLSASEGFFDGDVGIGTNSPASKLHIDSTGEALRFTRSSQETYRVLHGTSGLYFTRPDSAALGFGITQNSDFDIFDTSANVMFRADASTGNVGIGTTSPTTKLAIQSGISASSADVITLLQETNGAEKAAATIGISIGNSGASTNASDLWFATATGGSTSEKMRITSFGNVGIGTTSPNSYTNRKVLEINATWGGSIENSVSGTVKSRWDWSTGGRTQFGTYVNEPLDLITNSSPAVTILGDGNVGIGTTSPSTKLQISSTMTSAPTSNIFLDVDGSNVNGGGGSIVFGTSLNGSLTQYNAKITGTRASGGSGGDSSLGFWTTLASSSVSPL